MEWILFFWQKVSQSFWWDMGIILVIISGGSMIIQLQKAMLMGLLGAPSSCLCHGLKYADIALSTWCCTTAFVPLVEHILSSMCCASAGRCWTNDPAAQIFHLVTSVCSILSRKQWRAIDWDWVKVSRPWCLQYSSSSTGSSLWRVNFLHGVSIGCLPQCPHVLVVMVCALSRRSILKWISFD